MPNQTKNQRDYKDFCFRRRHDHFLRYRLLEADKIETYEAATELGFKLNMTDIEKGITDTYKIKKNRKDRKKQRSVISSIIISWLKHIFRNKINIY